MKKKLLIVTTSFPGLTEQTRHIGGAAFLFVEALALAKFGYDVQVIMPAIKNAPMDESSNGISITRIEYPLKSYNPGYQGLPQHGNKGKIKFFSQIFLAIYLCKSVFCRLRQEKYDFLWSNWLQVGVICSIANLRRTPHMVSLRGSDIRESSSILVKIMSKFVPNVLNMYPDDTELKGWIRKYSFLEHRVPGVYKRKNIIRKKHEEKIITIVGRLDGELSSQKLKGLGDELFKVLLKLLKARDDFSIVVVGDGRRLSEYKSWFSAVSKRISFLGWMTDFDVQLSEASMVLGGSGMNGVIMDTVPNGIPVLISKNLTGTLWRDKENCIVFNPDNNDQWLQTFIWALDNVHRLDKYASKAKQDIANFAMPIDESAVEWDKVISDYCKKYNDA